MSRTTKLKLKSYPTDDEHSLEVEVDEDGNIYSATFYNSFFDSWDDCLDRIKASAYWQEQISDAVSHFDWKEFGQELRYGNYEPADDVAG